MAGLKCPRCGLFSPETAERCDCGYEFKRRAAAIQRANDVTTPVDPMAKVSVVDVSMPFGSMVLFMVKWAIASIPALLILVALGMIVAALVGGMAGGPSPNR